MNVTSLLIHLVSALIMHATSTVDNLTSKLIQFDSSLFATKTVNSKLLKRVYFTWEGFHSQEQYGRRECLDVGIQSCGIGKNFQSTFCSILGEIDVVCDSNNIEDCHRVKGGSTIIKCSSRREFSKVLNKKEKLKIFILESKGSIMVRGVCSWYRGLWAKCKGLWKNKLSFILLMAFNE